MNTSAQREIVEAIADLIGRGGQRSVKQFKPPEPLWEPLIERTLQAFCQRGSGEKWVGCAGLGTSAALSNPAMRVQ